jgi:hypothetical protein
MPRGDSACTYRDAGRRGFYHWNRSCFRHPNVQIGKMSDKLQTTTLCSIL